MSSSNASEKNYLKNLGSFLGLYTLGRNKPILQIVSFVISISLKTIKYPSA